MTPPLTAALEALANDPTLTPEQRATARGALAAIHSACEVAARWGYDENGGLRWGFYTRAAEAWPDDFAQERIDLGVKLEELCRAVGVPIAGSAKDSAEC